MEDKTQRMAAKVTDTAERMGWFESAAFEEGDEVVAVAVVTKSMIEEMAAELVESNPALDLETCKRDLTALARHDFSPSVVWDNTFCYERFAMVVPEGSENIVGRSEQIGPPDVGEEH